MKDYKHVKKSKVIKPTRLIKDNGTERVFSQTIEVTKELVKKEK